MGGTDLLYDATKRDLIWHGNELVTVSGPENYKQQITLLFLTERGELLYYPDDGTDLYRMIDKSLSSSRIEEIQREVLRVCNSDPRTQGVDAVEVVKSSGKTEITANVRALDRSFALTIVIGADKPLEVTVEWA